MHFNNEREGEQTASGSTNVHLLRVPGDERGGSLTLGAEKDRRFWRLGMVGDPIVGGSLTKHGSLFP